MPLDNDLDDLFRQQLGPHATPPGAALQRRLAELAEAERLDSLFRAGLENYVSQPRRALWERLEDEHLHPPVRRRVAAWWQYSAAAVLLLLLLAGGVGLWRGYLGQRTSGAVAVGETVKDAAPERQGRIGSTMPRAAGGRATQLQQETQYTVNQPFVDNLTTSSEKNKKKAAARATATALSPSSPSIATAPQARRPAPARRPASSQPTNPQRPDADAGELAATSKRKAPASPPEPTDQPTVAAATPLAAPMGIVEVEVRRGPETTRPAPTPTVAAAEPQPERRPRLRLGGLLRQADRLVHGEAVSLAEATGPAESLTVQARIGGRLLSKTIQL